MRRIFLGIKKVLAVAMVLGFTVAAFAQPKIVAYVPNWVDLNSFSKTIDYAKLTHINIAFENPVNVEGDLSFNQKNSALIAQAQTQGVKVLISIGGGSASGNKTLLNRYAYLLNETNRAGFATKLADYVSSHGF